MIEISSEQKRILLENGVNKNWQIMVYDGNEYVTTIPIGCMVDSSLAISESLCSAQSLEVGACEASVFSVKLANLDVTELKDKKIVVKLNAVQNEVSIELDMGTYYVDDVPHENNTWFYNLVAYDSMILFDVNIHEWYESLNFPMTLLQFRTDLCAYIGVETAAGQHLPLDDLVIPKSTTNAKLTGRQA